MLYHDFLKQVMDETIVQAENGLYYLEPTWKQIVMNNKMFKEQVSDNPVYFDELRETLKLEVEKRNTINSKRPYVEDWLYDVITAQVEPAMLQEETDYIKQVTEFMKANHEAQNLKDKEEWENFKKT